MGLAHFVSTCPAQPPTLQAAQIWCVTQEGVCCGVCGNTLASLGSRVGLSATVFFSTAVTVIDGAESPFNFLTACVQAVAYLVAILLHGFGSAPLSRFHADYALVAALGFLCPLAASAVTAPHYNYGGRHPEPVKRLKRLNLNIDSRRQLGSITPASPTMTESQTLSEHSLGPFSASRDKDYIHVRRFRSRRRPAEEESAERRPLASTRVWSSTRGASSIESTPALLPARKESLRECDLEEGTDGRKSLVVLRHRQAGSRSLSRATPASLLAAGEPLFTTPPDSSSSTRSGSYRHQQLHSAHHQDSELLAPIQLPSPSIRPIVIHSGRSRSSSRVSDESDPLAEGAGRYRDSRYRRSDSINSAPDKYQRPSEERTANPGVKGAWRRYGMISANAALFAAWVATYLLARGRFGDAYRLGQADCPDPSGTALLSAAQTAGVVASSVVGLVSWANFYSHNLHFQLRRVFDYSRGELLWTRALVPAIFSGVIYCTWLTLLWTAYELSATPESSLLHETEESPTFASSLALALAVRPACDLLKAIWKYLHRRRQHRKLKKEATCG